MTTRAKEWIRRYLPAELLSLAATVSATLITSFFTNRLIITAISATWAGNIAYFGYILAADVNVARKALKEAGRQYTFTTFLKNLRALFFEFGLAELFDSLLIRPLLMYYLPIVSGNLLVGSIIGKIAADITFYIPAIISYEAAKSRYRKFYE